MSLSIGNSFFIREKISIGDIKEIQKNNSPIQLTLWEKIKDFFFSTGKEKAYSCIAKLNNALTELNSIEAKKHFLTLKDLASEEHKNHFLEYCYHDNYGEKIKVFELKDNRWETIIKFDYSSDENFFSYRVLDVKITNL
ncbi:hypothetical protein QE177_10960 [Arsenophonus sp. aPb]|uniref:hypothetical protein n=1 Tax=Arsenophonus sp. aPb TaxID=3041619 RepID=UPI002468882B|nr:hypothetical protein [Arsenophonus sp. aPb]WGL97718.1 hypothetical protein QE177_10960 [Arsenophonus sp. aPb]